MKLHSCYEGAIFASSVTTFPNKTEFLHVLWITIKKKKSIPNDYAAFLAFYFFTNNKGVHSKIPHILQLLESQDSSQARSKL